jgi:hypothetical protein
MSTYNKYNETRNRVLAEKLIKYKRGLGRKKVGKKEGGSYTISSARLSPRVSFIVSKTNKLFLLQYHG